MTSRTDIDTSWADLDDDDGQDDQPTRRRSGMDGGGDGGFDPARVLAELGPRTSAADMPAQTSFDDLGVRDDWHASATPPPVAAAWSAVEDAVEAAVEADRAERALDGEQAQAQRAEAARVRGAIAAGKPAKPSTSPGRDFSAERRYRAAVAAGYRERARRLRAEYDALIEQHREGWAARIVEGLPGVKAGALEQLLEASRLVEQLLGDAQAAQALLLEPGGSVVSLPTLPLTQLVERIAEVAGTIEASDQLGGVDLVHPRMQPSWRDRQQLAAGLMHGQPDSNAYWLADLEKSEGYRFSAFTRGIPLGERPFATTIT